MKDIVFCVALLLGAAIIIALAPPAYHASFYLSNSTSNQSTHAAVAVPAYFLYQTHLSLDVNDAELSHMRDVKTLLRILFVAEVIIIASLFYSKYRPTNALLKTGLVLLAIVAAILIPFQQSFMLFHQVFFPQGNYQFPASSQLIQLFPQSYFIWMGVWILLLYLCLLWVVRRVHAHQH